MHIVTVLPQVASDGGQVGISHDGRRLAASSREHRALALARIFGLAFAGVPATTATYLWHRLTVREFGSAFGVITLVFGVGQLLAPQIGGWLGDALSSFTLVFVLAAAVAAAASLGSGRLSGTQPTAAG
jgi:MFS family permease